MKIQKQIQELDEKKQEVKEFINRLDEDLRRKKITKRKYNALLKEAYDGKTKQELIEEIKEEKETLDDKLKHYRTNRNRVAYAGTFLVILVLIGVFSQYSGLESPTGLGIATQQVTETVAYDRVFEAYTETQLELTDITSLKISGFLDGTGALVKLRIGENEFIVADIQQPEQDSLITGMAIEEATETDVSEPASEMQEPEIEYTISTDKNEYVVGETVFITVEPDVNNKSLYMEYGEEIHKIEADTYVTEVTGEHNAIALVVLPDDILRLETGFTVKESIIEITTNETNATVNETINETESEINETVNETTNETETNNTANASDEIGYAFENLCLETCNLAETSNPVLIVELEEGAKLRITELIITQKTENNAPVQTQNIPDITLGIGQTTSIDLNEYFEEPDGDTMHYDINEIAEINANIIENELAISSDNIGTYTAFVYATDGDKLTTSNTFEIIIQEEAVTEPIEETPTTETNVSEHTAELYTTSDPCSNPDINQRPSTCFIGIEDKVYQDLSASIENRIGGVVGRFTRFGNFVIKGLIIQNAEGTPQENDFKIGFTQTIDFEETRTITVWIDSETGNLYIKGRLFEEQDVLDPPQFNTYIIQNKFGIVLGYFDEKTGDLHLKGNVVQLGKI